MFRTISMLAIASTMILVACTENPIESMQMQSVGNHEVAGPEDAIEEVKSIEDKLKTMSTPPTDTYETLMERIKQSSQSDGSVESLLESVLTSEFLSLVYTRNDLQAGFDWFAENHSGLGELLRRKDGSQAIYEKHQNMSIIGYSPDASLEEKGRYSLQVLFLETMLAQESVLANLPRTSYPRIAKTIFEGIELKNANPETYGYFSKLGSALVLLRMMKLANDSSIVASIKSNEDLTEFAERGHILSPENMNIIFSRGVEKYLNH